MAENKAIWVLIETEYGKAHPVGYELLHGAASLAQEKKCGLTAVVIGSHVEQICRDAIHYGADTVLWVDGAEYEIYTTDAFAYALTELVRKYRPEVLLIGATGNGRDLAPRVSCRLETGLTADCTGIGIDRVSGNITWIRPAFGGNLMATILCPERRPQMGTVRPGVFKKGVYDTGRTGVIRRENIRVGPELIRTRIVERVQEVTESVDLERANVIIAGGRGVGSAGNFCILRELADVVGGTVACSRAVVDAGWLPYIYQVGQSGKTVSPSLYFAIGISGAIQHLAGIAGAETVIAINEDPEAPIFGAADYGIVGNLHEVVPALTEALHRKKCGDL